MFRQDFRFYPPVLFLLFLRGAFFFAGFYWFFFGPCKSQFDIFSFFFSLSISFNLLHGRFFMLSIPVIAMFSFFSHIIIHFVMNTNVLIFRDMPSRWSFIWMSVDFIFCFSLFLSRDIDLFAGQELRAEKVDFFQQTFWVECRIMRRKLFRFLSRHLGMVSLTHKTATCTCYVSDMYMLCKRSFHVRSFDIYWIISAKKFRLESLN